MPHQSEKAKKTLVMVVGTRPNFVKAAPLWRVASCRDWCQPVLVHTGQHYDAGLSSELWRDLELPAPHADLAVGPGDRNWQFVEMQQRLEALLPGLNPAGIIVFGDVNSTLAGARAAARLELPLAHVEAGLRSFDSSMVEEGNRIAVDALSDIFFTTEPSAIENLRREKLSMKQVYPMGNLMVDCLKNMLPKARRLQAPLLTRLGLSSGAYAVLTLHRAENVDDISALKRFMETLAEMASELSIVFPVHPRTVKRLAQAWQTRNPPGLILTEPLSYLDFLALVAASRVVLTDSGGVQEETSVLGIPCLTLRNSTERPMTLSRGTNRLIGFDALRAQAALRCILANPAPVVSAPTAYPDDWDGKAAGRIIDVLEHVWG